MRKLLSIFKNPQLMPIVGIGAALFLWILDSIIDHFVFHPQESFLVSLWPDEPMELWMRLLVASLLIAFSWYARTILRHEVRAKEALVAHQSELEGVIVERTRELEENYAALKKEMAERQRIQGQLEMLATTDPLTLMFNRRKFEDLLGHELELRRHAGEFSLILFDVDHFKQVNDQHGHDIGDEVLRMLAEIVRGQLRRSDAIARWGGEEFIVLVPEADLSIAHAIADKLRRAVETGKFPRQQRITISLGVALARPDDTTISLIKRADQALYLAKQEGRNRAVVELS